MAKTRTKYCVEFKLSAIADGKLRGFTAAARDAKIHLTTLYEWKAKENELRKFSRTRGVDGYRRFRLNGSGRPPMTKPDVEEELLKWFNKLRSSDNNQTPKKVTLPMCVAHLKTLDQSLESASRETLRRRVWRIFKRRNVVDRAITHHCQKTRACSKMMEGFSKYVLELAESLNIGPANILNFDQTNVFFSPEAKRTLSMKGEKTISAFRADCSHKCTAMLGVSCSGVLFPPYMVFKGKNTPGGAIRKVFQRVEAARETQQQCEGFPTNCFYTVQDNGWMESKLVVDWANKVVKPYTQQNGPVILLLDEFSGHQTREVRDALIDADAFVVYIPGGYTWKLQVMDVGINKPFKDKVRDFYETWLIQQENPKPTRDLVANWINDAFKNITQSTIHNTWRRIGIVFPQSRASLEEDDSNNNDNDMGAEKDDYDDDDDDFLALAGFEILGIAERTEEEEEADRYYEMSAAEMIEDYEDENDNNMDEEEVEENILEMVANLKNDNIEKEGEEEQVFY